MTSIDIEINNFNAIYQNIYNIYISEENPVDKWTSIAKFVNDKNNDFYNFYFSIEKNLIKKDIKLNYTSDLTNIHNQIKTENINIVKASLIITSLHIMIYDLMSTSGNYYSSLEGKNEIYTLKKNIIYYTDISEKNEQNIYFHTFILIYALESLFNKHFYIGIDFEYTFKKIQLAQLNFEHNISLKSFIMLVSPNELEPDMMKNFIELIICNKYIKKILHGSDALDIPYVYQHMLSNNPTLIINFTKTLIDTRFLCEYYKLNRQSEMDNKCSVYAEDPNRSAIYYFGLISENEQNKLTQMLESLQHVNDISWNIHKLSKNQALYAQYDVIFLKYFYYRIIYMATLDVNTELEKKDIINLYRHVLYELTQFIYLEKENITFLTIKCKEQVDLINNYMMKTNNQTLKLIDVYNNISIDLVTFAPKIEIDKLLKVNHYKTRLIIIIKKIVYTIISQKCTIYQNKNTIWKETLSNQFVFDFFNEMEFYYLSRMFKEIDKIIQARLNEMKCAKLKY